MEPPLTTADLLDLLGEPVLSADGESAGRLAGVYCDVVTGATEWLIIEALDDRRRVIPMHDAQVTERGLQVAFGSHQIQMAPEPDHDRLEGQSERSLCRHYGLPYLHTGRLQPSAQHWRWPLAPAERRETHPGFPLTAEGQPRVIRRRNPRRAA